MERNTIPGVEVISLFLKSPGQKQDNIFPHQEQHSSLDNLPPLCGFDCPEADFPPADSAGICRTMAAVYCRRLQQLVDKNRPCRVRQREGIE